MDNNNVKINFGGEEVEAEEMTITSGQEVWNHYIVDDGTLLKMKLILKKIFRVKGKYDPEGNPVYIMQSTNVTTVSAPVELKKKN